MREVPATPVLLVNGSRESQCEISHSPYTVGRMPGSDVRGSAAPMKTPISC
jgi:phosphoserine phosphatase RsbU/P